MSEDTTPKPKLEPPEPRWPALVAAAVIGLLYLALPKALSVGPRWLATVVIFVLAAATVITHHAGNSQWNHYLGHVLSWALTVFLIWSLVLLIKALPAGKEPAVGLLTSAASLWVTNVLVFALWYWGLDGGGPYERDHRAGHETGAFLFPQMTSEGCRSWEAEDQKQSWSPQFVDYLFLAFNTSTAFSPTDSPVLSRWAKMMTMGQSLISLTIVAILAGRAVNII